jgi:hypothetical protein
MYCWLRPEHWHGVQRTDEGKLVCNILSSCSGVDNSNLLGYDYVDWCIIFNISGEFAASIFSHPRSIEIVPPKFSPPMHQVVKNVNQQFGKVS